MDTEAIEAEAKSESRFTAKIPWKARQSGGHKSRAENAKHEPEGKSGSKARGIFIGQKAAVEALRRPCRTGPTNIFGNVAGTCAPDTALELALTGVVACRRVPSRDWPR
ncbi:hypothetical protein RF55_14594 [Lasius niger]|uniref:Uncharacterized protein n=1 Tax=Lasius niger TaxID=67767 RepID=A0A0J7JX05_LASNI|nr:hypothetical protein RF55_23437 [Lasius niger]KMQ82444.1 hypothetical protein RF55_22965 [Lasius niger]KMQ82599.1 hypothetical protein RF55_22425 [Lasius niger]KMQ84066.1 hypothetical protein RF55_18482 [Lasius niger]KMQ84267.1 hypothetical protein RF55_18075 [Lasius niger]